LRRALRQVHRAGACAGGAVQEAAQVPHMQWSKMNTLFSEPYTA